MEQNVSYEVKGDELVIKVNLKKELGPSASGKTILIGTTGGAVQVGNGALLNMTVYKKPSK